MLDGVFARDAAGVLGFHPAHRLTTLDVAEVLAAVEPRIRGLLEGRGLDDGDRTGGGVDEWADEAPVLARLAATLKPIRACLSLSDNTMVEVIVARS